MSFSGITRGRFSITPPPVIFAKPLIVKALEQLELRSSRRCVVGRSSSSASVHPSSSMRALSFSFARSSRTLRASEKPLECSPLRSQSDEHVAGAHFLRIRNSRSFGETDGEACEIVFAGLVDARHLRRLTADQAHPGVLASLRDALHDRQRDGPR